MDRTPLDKMNCTPLDVNKHASQLLENEQQLEKDEWFRSWLWLFMNMDKMITLKMEDEEIQGVIETVNLILSMSSTWKTFKTTEYMSSTWKYKTLQNTILENLWEQLAHAMVVASCDCFSSDQSKSFKSNLVSTTENFGLVVTNMDLLFERAADMDARFKKL